MEEERRMEITSKPFQRSKACIATNSTLVQPFILGGGASLSQSRASQPCLSPASYRWGTGGWRDSLEREREGGRERERETPRRRGRNAITAALNLFEVHCATGGGVNGNATSSTSLLPPRSSSRRSSPFRAPLRAEDRHNATGEGRGWLENNRRADLFSSLFPAGRKRGGGERAPIAANSRR